MTEVATPHPLIPSRRTLQQAEIIDVDSLQSPEQPPVRRRRIEAPLQIDLTGDSDEDVEMTAGPSSGITRSNPRRRPWSQRQPSLPAPPRRHRPIPQVPPVPQEFRTQQSFLARTQPRSVEAGVVRPASTPFAFEADLVRNEGTTFDRLSPPLAAAPRSHHQPNMALGGAYARIHREQPRERERRMMTMDHDDGAFAAPRTFFLGRLTDQLSNRIAAMFGGGTVDEVDTAVHDLLGHPDSARQVRFANRPLVEDYKPSYTHPDKPAGGFTHDFAQADPIPILDISSAGSSSKPLEIVEYNTVLVCAKCQDPLVINAPSDDEKARRVYALRCGHMVDGKCIGRLIDDASSAPGYPLATTSKSTSKGKGKAKEVEIRTEFSAEAPVAELSIRSRLRSHVSASTSIGPTPALPPSPPKKKVAGKGKGKAKLKDVIEDQREWVCPVEKCESKHCCIKMEGVWAPAKENGPIALFL